MDKYRETAARNRKYFVLGPLFMILEACGEIILPYMNANMINRGAAMGDVAYILQNGLRMALLAVLMMAAGVLGGWFAINGASRVAADVRSLAFSRIQEFSFSNIDDFSSGSLITRVTNDVTQIQNFIQSLLRSCFRSPVMLIGAVFMSFVMKPELAAVICLVIPLLGFAIFRIVKLALPRYTDMQKQLDAMNNQVSETVTNERVIKSFVREDYERKRFEGVNAALQDKSVRALKLMVMLQPVSAAAVNATTLAVVWIAGRQIMVGGMEVGTLTAFITYLSQILTSLNMLANIILQGARAAASDRRISEVLQAKVDLAEPEEPEKPGCAAPEGEIEFRNVSFRYFKNNPEQVLEHVSLKIRDGSFTGIIGSTGSGKTTLVSLIPRLYDADAGTVLVGGTDVRELSFDTLRSLVSVVLQQNTLFSGTIAENLRWGSENASDEELAWACRIAQADGFIRGFRDGYETELEQGGRNLSGGQRQRLCIARALLRRSRILILDDSTSAVDTATDAAIRRAFRNELPGVTKIVIAQRIHSVIDADQIIVMDGGRVADAGTHAELLARCSAYQEIYDSQINGTCEERRDEKKTAAARVPGEGVLCRE